MLRKLVVLTMTLGVAFGVLLLAGRSATFVCSRSLTVAKPPDAVWSVLADVDRWPQWWPGVVSARLNSGWHVGGALELDLNGRPEREPARIEGFAPERETTWSRPGVLGSIVRTTLRIAPAAGGTEVKLESSIRGPQAVFARLTGRKAFDRYHQAVLAALRAHLQQFTAAAKSGESHARH
jgi:uncharacterized protein YndB with AHSA1/START domain